MGSGQSARLSRLDNAAARGLAAGLLGGRAEARTAEPFGAGKFSQTFLVRTDADDYVLRVGPPDDLLQLFYEYRMMRQEPALHRLIAGRTDVPIPPIIAWDFSRERIDRDYLLMPRLPGRPLSETPGLPAAQQQRILRDLGRHVARLHAVRIRRFGYVGRHRPMTPQPDWPSAFAIMWATIWDDCRRCGGVAEADHVLAADLFDRHRGAFDPHTPAALCHMDLWAANLLVHDGRLEAVFDFDRACWGDPGCDLAVAEYCGLTTPAFWAGYGRRPPGGADAAVRRWFYLIYEHVKYVVIRLSARRNDPAGAARYADDCRQAMRRFDRTGEPVF